MAVNFDLIPRDKHCASYCETPEEAEEFLNEMFAQYPDKCRNWKDGVHNWSQGPCYNPNFDEPNSRYMYHDRYGFYEKNGYVIIPFSDLLSDNDFEASEQSLELLFGVGV